MNHTLYVLAAYAISAVTLTLICLWVWMDSRLRKKELAQLEAAGIRRRSTPAPQPASPKASHE
jgi:heme exporter protein D